MTRVKRSEIDKLFEQPQSKPQPIKNIINHDIKDCYTLIEVQKKYKVLESTVQQLIERNSILKIKKGWYAYVPKIMIDKVLK